MTYWGAVQAQTLTIYSVTPNPICANSKITVYYQFTGSAGVTVFLLLNGPNTADLTIAAVSASSGYGSLQGTIPIDRVPGSYSVRLQLVSPTGTIFSPDSDVFTVKQKPDAPTTTAVNTCHNGTSVSLATGVTSGISLKWYANATGGVGVNVAPYPPTTSIGASTYYVSQTVNECESDRAAITFRVKEIPPAPTVTPNPIEYCQNATAVPLTATTVPGGIPRFYIASSGGTGFTSITPSTSAGNNYYVSQIVDGCEGPRTQITVAIKAVPEVAITGLDNTYCRDAAAITLSGSPTGGSFFVDNTQATVFSPGSLSAGLHTVTYSYTNQLGCSKTAGRQITIYPAPVTNITANPSLDILHGQNVTLNVTSGASSYQWQLDQGAGFTNIGNAEPYSGSTTSKLTIASPTTEMNGYKYQVIVVSGCGRDATSQPVILTVHAKPGFTTPPPNTTACADAGISFNVVATDATSYQWQLDQGSGFVDITNQGPYSGVNSATLSISTVTTSMNNHKFQVVATGFVGSTTTSSAAVLTVNTAGQWLGNVDTDWNNTANWSCGLVPTATTDVVIPVASFMPEISGSGAVCHDLTITSGASLTISGQFESKGNVVNNGTLQVPGTIIFSGDAQVLPSGTYASVFVQGTGVKELEGNVNITGTLSFSGSYLKLGSYDLLIDNEGNISGFNKNGFVITDGTGRLKRGGLGNTGQSGFVTFPVGTSLSSYTPLFLKNTGTDDVFAVRVISGIYSKYDAEDNPSGLTLTQFNVDKTWLVSEQDQGGSVATLTFEWNESDEQPGFLRNFCFGSHYYNDRWNQSVTASAGEAEPYSISIEGVTNFSPFGVGSVGSALPLRLLTFTSSPTSENVSLNWQTTYEFNTSGFDIEASSDAVHFSNVGHVASSNNNTAEISKYHFSAEYLKAGERSYYRLKMLDQDGTFSYSKILGVRNPEAIGNNYQIFPNPVSGQYLTVKASKVLPGTVEVSIYDVSGRLMYETKVDSTAFTSQQVKVPIQNLSPGRNYILKIDEMATGISQHFKFFKK